MFNSYRKQIFIAKIRLSGTIPDKIWSGNQE